MGVAFPVHRSAQPVAVVLDPVAAVAATYHPLEKPFRSMDRPHISTAVLASLDSVEEFLADDRFVSTCVFLAIVADFA